MVSLVSVKNITRNNKSLKIEWKDGKKSIFHYMWLRDNCPSGIHPTARQRIFNFLTVSENIHPISFTIKKDKKLEIVWSEQDHKSIYDLFWLRKNCYTIKNTKKYKSPYVFWNKNLIKDFKKVTINYDEIISSDKGLTKWLEQLHIYGFSLVKKAPTKKNSAFKILNKISHIRETFFGTPFEVVNIPNPNNTAYTASGLRNHTDLPYYEYSPGYQFLHCLINKAKGGLSSAVDGFSVANYLKKNEPEVFKILTSIYVKFKDNDYTQNTIRIFHSPLITLDKDKDYNDIRFSIATMAAMDCNPKVMEKFYSAYRRFAFLLHNKRFTINFRLEAGDIFSFNNRRILHGRTEFNPNSGHRHLQGYYIDRDDILARLNFLKKIKI